MVGRQQNRSEDENGILTSNNLLGKDGVRNRSAGMHNVQLLFRRLVILTAKYGLDCKE
jgi:hypothetical protein